VIAVVAAGCGSTEPAPSPESHPIQFAQALCATVFRCCPPPGTPGPLARWTGTPPDQTVCENTIAQSLTDRLKDVRDSLNAGRIAYSEKATRACLADLERARCEDFRWSTTFPTTGCWSLTGGISTGGGCLNDFDCAEGRCNLANGGMGVCVTVPAAGERCQNACRRGLVCSGVCRPAPEKTAGSPCSDNIECRSRLCGPAGMSIRFTCAPVQACGFLP
jgi:hypothetical protein